jgi:hypothetical protein
VKLVVDDWYQAIQRFTIAFAPLNQNAGDIFGRLTHSLAINFLTGVPRVSKIMPSIIRSQRPIQSALQGSAEPLWISFAHLRNRRSTGVEIEALIQNIGSVVREQRVHSTVGALRIVEPEKV